MPLCTGVVSTLVLDIIYIALTLALFALVSLVAKGVERTGPSARGSAQREAMSGEARG
jgi:hypothetical protein